MEALSRQWYPIVKAADMKAETPSLLKRAANTEEYRSDHAQSSRSYNYKQKAMMKLGAGDLRLGRHLPAP
jgi:hypothetical protein